jgi:S-adenosylmethionine synthetase
MVQTFGTHKISEERIGALVQEHFDLRPFGILGMLDLLRPNYNKTAAYGHFGSTDGDFSWEPTDNAHDLRTEAAA